MTTGAFNDPGGDGNPRSERLVVLQIGRVVEEIVCTFVHGLPFRRGQGPERGTAAHARGHQAGLPAQDASRCARVQPSCCGSWSGKKATAAFQTYWATWRKSTTMTRGMFRSSASCWR